MIAAKLAFDLIIMIYSYKVVISVASNFDWVTLEKHGNVGKIAKIIIYDKARVNGGNNYDYSVHHWIPELVNKNDELEQSR